MPAKSGYKRRYRKRQYKQRGLVRPKGVVTTGKYIPSISGLFDRQPITFRYQQSIQFNTGPLPVTRTWYMNGPNDADVLAPGTGILPSAYSQWTDLYSRCYCTSSKIIVRCYNPNQLPVRVAVYPTNDLSTPTSMEQVTSKPRGINRLVTSLTDARIIVNSATVKAVTGESHDVDHTFLMIARPTPPSPGIPAQNPKTQCYWNLAFQCHDNQTAVAMRFEVEIYYNCMMYQRQLAPPPSSSTLVDFGSSAI